MRSCRSGRSFFIWGMGGVKCEGLTKIKVLQSFSDKMEPITNMFNNDWRNSWWSLPSLPSLYIYPKQFENWTLNSNGRLGNKAKITYDLRFNQHFLLIHFDKQSYTLTSTLYRIQGFLPSQYQSTSTDTPEVTAAIRTAFLQNTNDGISCIWAG